jgi:hypothetical protein
MQDQLIVGSLYQREQVAEIVHLPLNRRKGGDWATGYAEWDGATYIFANVGVAGRTGHDYPNSWRGTDLVWYAKANARLGQPVLTRMISNSTPVHLFWRAGDRTPFTYAGVATAIDVRNSAPVEVTWAFETAKHGLPEIIPGPKDPRWRRGPPPASTAMISTPDPGPASVYVMRLTGPLSHVVPKLQPGEVVIKVGRSNDLSRRLRELNFGMPPNGELGWKMVHSRKLPTADDAHAAETVILERLRVRRQWIAGEFAIVMEDQLGSVLE